MDLLVDLMVVKKYEEGRKEDTVVNMMLKIIALGKCRLLMMIAIRGLRLKIDYNYGYGG